MQNSKSSDTVTWFPSDWYIYAIVCVAMGIMWEEIVYFW